MKLIVGLGNPGREYENTRHNAGFFVIDRLAERHAPSAVARGRFSALTFDVNIKGEKAILLKPTIYMNRSGRSVSEALRFFKLDASEDLIVFVDDVALPVGHLRIRAQGSAGGHNGLVDIEQHVGSDIYARCRIGIGAPGSVPGPTKQVDYVLGKFTDEQREQLKPAIDDAANAAEHWIEADLVSVMNRFNTTKPKPEPKPKPTPENRSQSAADREQIGRASCRERV